MNPDEPEQPVIGFAGKKWEVHKFGGTSVANADCYRMAASIVEEQIGIHTDTAAPKDLSLAVVVSAMGGKPKTTDLLLGTVEAAANRNNYLVEQDIAIILEKHCKCLDALFERDEAASLKTVIHNDLNDIRDILKTVALMKWQAARISELVSGYGELWSAQILAALLHNRSAARTERMKAASASSLNEDTHQRHYFRYLDARRVITIDEDAIKDGAVCWDVSQAKLQQVYEEELLNLPQDAGVLHFVITGYVASNSNGVATTLGRDGSDYSASIMGKILSSSSVTIWTDVDGVLSADPRRVPTATVLSEVSYNEAMELAYFGAKVIHPKTMQPAISAFPQIPIFIRNTFNSSFRGTRIYTSSQTHTDRDRCVCGFSSIEQMALINVEGSGLIGIPGVAKRMFGTLESIGVNVVLISQASSEHSITFATLAASAQRAKVAIEEEFHKELREKRINDVDLVAPCSIIAAVGDGMSATAGVSGRFFSALGDAKINVLAISQGCSERNISAVVLTSESTRALRAVHAAFSLSHTTVRVGIIGITDLGDSLLKLLESQRSKMRDSYEVDLQVCAVMTDGSSPEVVKLKEDNVGMNSISIASYNQCTGGAFLLGAPAVGFEGKDSTEIADVAPGGLDAFTTHLVSDECAHHVIFDCTSEEALGKCHAQWLNAGIHVVTANNTGLAGPQEQRNAISAAEVARGKLSAQYLREVTVGGALPILGTLRSLLNSGDKVTRVDGILSVSLSYIMFRVSPPPNFTELAEFDELSSRGAFRGDLSMSPSSKVGQAVSFSEAIKEAVALGLMEDDPGKDIDNDYSARVCMVLAKELGLDHSFTTQQIMDGSDKLVDTSTIDFNAVPAEVDQQVQDRVAAATSRGCVIRQISSVDVKSGQIEIKLVEVPVNHAFAVTPPSCECVRFFTQRHRRYPLIIQGAAAGADSTSSGMLAELLNFMRTKVGTKQGLSKALSSSAFISSS
jgi:bifunctional aspartokinase / homoserine dehydrogenase 1